MCQHLSLPSPAHWRGHITALGATIALSLLSDQSLHLLLPGEYVSGIPGGVEGRLVQDVETLAGCH